MTLPTVFIVDDDPAIRDSLALLLETAGIEVECHESAEAFLGTHDGHRPGCLVLDVRMKQMSGPDLQAELVRRGSHLPIIFLTAHGDIPMTVRAMKAGAVDFLTKPVDGGKLLELVQGALQQHRQIMDHDESMASQRERLMALTPREREIMGLILAGHSNKAIGRHLGISHRTVEIHRARILHKTGVSNVLELAHFALECGLTVEGSDAPPAPV